MKRFLIILIAFLISSTFLQAKDKTATSKYAGIYQFGKSVAISSVKSVYVYPESDSTILIYASIYTKAPSLNTGDIYVRIRITNDTGSFYYVDSLTNDNKDTCSFNLKFSKEKLQIVSPDNCECHFGHNAFIQGDYKRISKKAPDYFIDMLNRKNYFKSEKPENELSK